MTPRVHAKSAHSRLSRVSTTMLFGLPLVVAALVSLSAIVDPRVLLGIFASYLAAFALVRVQIAWLAPYIRPRQ